jgi:hypothetical protein
MTDNPPFPANSAAFDRYFASSLDRMVPEGSREDRLLSAIAKSLDCLSHAPECAQTAEAAAILREAIAQDR